MYNKSTDKQWRSSFSSLGILKVLHNLNNNFDFNLRTYDMFKLVRIILKRNSVNLQPSVNTKLSPTTCAAHTTALSAKGQHASNQFLFNFS